MAPIRVLHCVAGMGRGGYESFIMNIYRQLDREVVQFDFVSSLPGVYDAEIEALGGLIHRIPFITQKGPFVYAAGLRRVLRENPQYRIVHSHMDQFSGMVMRVAKRCGVPVRIAHSHNTAADGGPLYRLVKGYYGLFIAANCTHRWACGQDAARWLFGRRANEATIVHNAIDLDAFTPTPRRREEGRALFGLKAGDGPVVGHIGRFYPVKNQAFVLDIFAALQKQHPNARLLLAGSGPMLEQVKAKAGRLGLEEGVRFLGDCDQVPALLQALDVFLLPSLYEGLPVVMVEAQAAGLPCVVSNTVAQEADLTGLVRRMPLDAAPEAWAETAATAAQPRQDTRDAMSQAGYSARDVAAFMQETYVQMWRETERTG